jgi:hypothetical protein
MTKQQKPGAGAKRIPSATAPGYLAIYDSQDLVGTIVEHDSSHFCYGADGVLIGKYPTRAAAVAALPRVS